MRARRRVAGGGTRGTRARRSIASVHRRPIARETRGAGRSSRGAGATARVVRRRCVHPVPRRDLPVIPILALVVDARPRRSVIPSSPSFSSATRSLDLDVDAPHADPNARVWYLPNFLDADAFAAVSAGCEKLRKRMKSDHSFATGRLSAVVPPTSEAYAAFCNARALRKLRDASGSEELVLGDYPVEARLYRPGSSMAWHQDVVLYERPQVELIYTVVNDSDGRTEWVGSDGFGRGLAPPANSALVFEAGAAWHRVAASSEGTRTIVKALYVEDFAKTDAFAEVMEEAPWRR